MARTDARQRQRLRNCRLLLQALSSGRCAPARGRPATCRRRDDPDRRGPALAAAADPGLCGGLVGARPCAVPIRPLVLPPRMERAVARLNARLDRPIAAVQAAERHDMIVRLVYDPTVMEAVGEHARTGLPVPVAFAEARAMPARSCRAFRPSCISAWPPGRRGGSAGCSTGSGLAAGDGALAGIDPRATVVFVMNHRSNMDYVLVTWLVATVRNFLCGGRMGADLAAVV